LTIVGWLALLSLVAYMVLAPAPEQPLQHTTDLSRKIDRKSSSNDLADGDETHKQVWNEASQSLRDEKQSANKNDKQYEWCFDCEDRCANILKGLFNNNINLDDAGRAIKYAALSDSGPKFFRGTDHLYLQDVIRLTDHRTEHRPASATALDAYLSNKTKCFNDADQHIMNFGTFQDSQNQIVYDLNDFDQAMVAHYVIDLFRLATSVVMHSTLNGLPEHEVREVTNTLVTSYVEGLKSYVGNDNETDFQLTRANTVGPLYDLLMGVETNNVKYSRAGMLNKFTVMIDSGDKDASGEPILVRQLDLTRDDLQPVTSKKTDALIASWPTFVNSIDADKKFRDDFYGIKHVVAKRVGAGVGSLGNDRYYVLVEGNTLAQDDDVILDVKHEPEPEWYWHLTDHQRDNIMKFFTSQGQRVASGFAAMNGRRADALLGWLEMNDKSGSYFVRQRSPWKAGLNNDLLVNRKQWLQMAEQWGLLLATNHARSDNDYNADFIDYSFEEEFSKLVDKDFNKLVVDFAFKYNSIVDHDYKCFAKSDLNPNRKQEETATPLTKTQTKEEEQGIKEEKKKEKK
jgi:uncharacterized protein (DUF2252 family)